MAYPYNGYMNPQFNPYYQQQYQTQPTMYNQQPMQPQYQAQPIINNQPTFQPTFVNGIEGAKAYILMPNQSIWLKDSDNENVLYIKSANQEGKCTLQAFNLQPINLDNVGKQTIQTQNDYLTKNDFNAFLSVFNDNMNNLSTLIEKRNNETIRQVKNDNTNNKGVKRYDK